MNFYKVTIIKQLSIYFEQMLMKQWNKIMFVIKFLLRKYNILCYKHTLSSLNLIHVLITLLRDFDGEFQKKSWHMLYVTKIIVVLYFLFIWLNEDAIISLSSQINTVVWKKKLFEEETSPHNPYDINCRNSISNYTRI